jgi:hypothetical protein
LSFPGFVISAYRLAMKKAGDLARDR